MRGRMELRTASGMSLQSRLEPTLMSKGVMASLVLSIKPVGRAASRWGIALHNDAQQRLPLVMVLLLHLHTLVTQNCKSSRRPGRVVTLPPKQIRSTFQTRLSERGR